VPASVSGFPAAASMSSLTLDDVSFYNTLLCSPT
jgi:hypothetical protein